MKKYVIASVLCLALGPFVPGQVHAEESGHHSRTGTYSTDSFYSSSRQGSHIRDTSPPTITPKVTGTEGNSGWYTSDVSVSWQVSDPESRIRSTSGCETVSLTTDTTGVTYTCTATSKGGTSTQSVTIKRDATRPSTEIASPASGASYALNQAVKASYSCGDATAGVASCTGTVANGSTIDTSASGAKSFSVTAEDNAGNRTTRTVDYTVEGAATGDTTPPVVTPAVTGTLGANGWYTSNVEVSWKVSDPESAISSTSGCDTVTVSSDTSGTSFVCSATSAGGTTVNSVNIKRDATPPKATIVTPGSGVNYSLNQTVTANYNCTDATSGVGSCTGTVANGSAIDTGTTGTKSFTVTAKDEAGNQAAASVSYSVGSSTVVTSTPGTQLFAWNDLGMHCTDADFSIFSLLPPFNDLNAQLVVDGKLVSSGYTLTYEATPDPSGSVNSTSRYKTNFWDFAQPLFGTSPAPDVGLTGFPMASFTPAQMRWNGTYNWFEATGIPATPIDDNQNTNYFPMVKVTAFDSSGQEVASSDTVLPISNEINCNTCHASNTGSPAAEPAGGWVDLTPGSQEDWRLNILRLHDERNSSNSTYASLLLKKGYGSGLEAAAESGTPVLCDGCHNSNALSVWGIKGEPGVSNLTAAMHTLHSSVSLPGSTQTLDSIGTRDACYNCHPGRKTQCLRGAMGNPVDAAGNHIMECQSCHGSMLTVGNKARNGWFDMPRCQSCHHDGIRETVAINPDGTFKTWSDTRFASNPDTPEPGTTLYRYSTGHGGLQCEACHNSTHAEFTDVPSGNGNETNDNLRAIKAQGYVAEIRECTVCHPTMPSTVNGGPHGMHPIGEAWVSAHHSDSTFQIEPKSECFYCHGSTSSGSPLAEVKVTKVLNNRTFTAGTRITCWSCHNGPNPDD